MPQSEGRRGTLERHVGHDEVAVVAGADPVRPELATELARDRVVGVDETRRGSRHELEEGESQGLDAPVVVKVVRLDVGHRDERGTQEGEGSIALVGLQHELGPLAEPRVRPEAGDVGADQP